MNPLYANEFGQIPMALALNHPLRSAMLALIASEPVPGAATEGGDRLLTFRRILNDLTTGADDLQRSIQRVDAELPRVASPHAANNRVFANGWAERLVRIQFSRFYNQAVLEELVCEGVEECFVPPSAEQQANSQCSQILAGHTHRVQDLLTLLRSEYGGGNFTRTPKIPDHPHCTHVVRPLREDE